MGKITFVEHQSLQILEIVPMVFVVAKSWIAKFCLKIQEGCGTLEYSNEEKIKAIE